MPQKIKLIFLGTSDSIPSATRNHSAILLTFNEENILFDCGEGTQSQFRKAGLNPGKITRILITHWHGDHTLGLLGLIQTLILSGYNKTLYIYGPKGTCHYFSLLKNFLGSYEKFSKMKINVKEVLGKFFENDIFYLEAESMKHGVPCNAYNFVIKDKIRIDKKKLSKCKIPPSHIHQIKNLKEGKDILCNGKKIKAKDLIYTEKGKKISFILDSAFNDKMIDFSRDADLLISEASFGKELESKAKEHLHMTSEQAATVAKRAKVKKLILTHISSRYEKNLKKILDEAKKVFKNSYLVKDLDVVEV